jgi:uncharacterized damage-inducible protein DinB
MELIVTNPEGDPMFHTINEFEATYTGEIKTTQKVLEALTDESLAQCVADDHRNIARIAWHIATTIPEMIGHTGLKVDLLSEDSPMPAKASDIAHSYGAVSRALIEIIGREWKDEDLEVVDEMYGEKWARKSTLQALIMHEIHHRGQLTVLMRQAGLRVPSIYGPAKEDWSQYGMEEPKI